MAAHPTDNPLYPFTWVLSEAERALQNTSPSGAISDGWHLEQLAKAGRELVRRFNGIDLAPLVAARRAVLAADPGITQDQIANLTQLTAAFMAEAAKLADSAIEKES
jgi:hypothetical protein